LNIVMRWRERVYMSRNSNDGSSDFRCAAAKA
jgi:hypothetical protein